MSPHFTLVALDSPILQVGFSRRLLTTITVSTHITAARVSLRFPQLCRRLISSHHRRCGPVLVGDRRLESCDSRMDDLTELIRPLRCRSTCSAWPAPVLSAANADVEAATKATLTIVLVNFTAISLSWVKRTRADARLAPTSDFFHRHERNICVVLTMPDNSIFGRQELLSPVCHNHQSN